MIFVSHVKIDICEGFMLAPALERRQNMKEGRRLQAAASEEHRLTLLRTPLSYILVIFSPTIGESMASENGEGRKE